MATINNLDFALTDGSGQNYWMAQGLMAHQMKLIFTKGADKYDRMDLLRDGVVTSSVQCPKQGIIPHDMIHFAVESTLHLRGYMTRALAGDDSGYRMAATPESDGVERLVEVIQADGWSGWTSDPAAMLDLYRVTCEARDCSPVPIAADDLLAVRERILELTSAWQKLSVGDSLTLDF